MKVINLGSLNLDKVYSVEQFVSAGQTIPALDFAEFCGGKGLNQSVALARAGAEVYHLGALGGDGHLLRETLEAAGVHTEYLATLDEASGQAIIQVDSRGQNCIIVCAGTNERISEDQISEALAAFGPDDLLVTQNETSGGVFAMRKAKALGLKVGFNPSPLSVRLKEYPMALVDYLILNELEGRVLAGVDAGGNEVILEALAARFPQAAIILTVGKDGVLYRDGNRRLSHGIYDVPVVDTTGAGDTFCGYFFGSLARGCNAEAALRYASVASSLAVSAKGTSASIPSWSQTLAAADSLKPL